MRVTEEGKECGMTSVKCLPFSSVSLVVRVNVTFPASNQSFHSPLLKKNEEKSTERKGDFLT